MIIHKLVKERMIFHFMSLDDCTKPEERHCLAGQGLYLWTISTVV